MSKVGIGVVLLGLWSAVAASGCGQGEDASYAGTEAYCDGLCQAAQRCGFVGDRERCFGACMTNADAHAAMSEQGGVAFGACVSELECARLEDEVAFDECWASAKERTPVTSRTRSFCRVYTEREFECGYSYSMDECELDFRMWADEVLELMTDCSNIEGCEDRVTCGNMVFE